MENLAEGGPLLHFWEGLGWPRSGYEFLATRLPKCELWNEIPDKIKSGYHISYNIFLNQLISRDVQFKGVLNPNFRPFSFELKKLDFMK